MSSDVSRLEAEVEQRRAALERTATSLSEKVDVRARGSQAAHRLEDAVTTSRGRPRPELLIAAAGLAVLVGAAVWWRRRS